MTAAVSCQSLARLGPTEPQCCSVLRLFLRKSRKQRILEGMWRERQRANRGQAACTRDTPCLGPPSFTPSRRRRSSASGSSVQPCASAACVEAAHEASSGRPDLGPTGGIGAPQARAPAAMLARVFLKDHLRSPALVPLCGNPLRRMLKCILASCYKHAHTHRHVHRNELKAHRRLPKRSATVQNKSLSVRDAWMYKHPQTRACAHTCISRQKI